MRSDYYAKPDSSRRVRYCEGDEEDESEWDESEGNLYDNPEEIMNDQADFQSQEPGKRRKQQRIMGKTNTFDNNLLSVCRATQSGSCSRLQTVFQRSCGVSGAPVSADDGWTLRPVRTL